MRKIKHFRLVTKNEWGKRGKEQHKAFKKKQLLDFFAKRTTPGIPTWSPTVVLAWPDR
jgi:hypothetical protein